MSYNGKPDRFYIGYDGDKLPTLRTMLRWLFYKKDDESRMSQYGIRLPAPKLDMPGDPHAETKYLLDQLKSMYPGPLDPGMERRVYRNMDYYHRHWRIERSRADDLERMVEQLEMENRRLRKPRILSLFKRK